MGAFVRNGAQLGLLLVAIAGLEIESGFDLPTILPVIGLGYCAHAWLPAAWKLPFFLLLSCLGFSLVLGVQACATVFALGLALIGVCHLPLRLGWRIALLLGIGIGLTLLRGGALALPWSPAVLPMLGSMFLFRLAIYLYDEHTGRRPASIWMRLSYFCLLPNVCFLLFPVIDYRTYQRTYYEQPAAAIHARGLRWILRGVLHLLAYRIVVNYWSLDSSGVVDLAGVMRFVSSSFLLYLRISGHFHLIIGFLHLFGFHLPETNHLYWLATSFSDCWRRTNIYWTNFMKKLVYFPVFMRLRKQGNTFALVIATLLVFVATWLLHALQWFWLQGELPVTTDGLFWGLAGGFALASVLREARRGDSSALQPPVNSWRLSARAVLKAAMVFIPCAVTWSFWSSPSTSDWLDVLSMSRNTTPIQVASIGGAVAAIFLLTTVASRFLLEPSAAVDAVPGPRGAALQWVACGSLALLGLDSLSARVAPSVQSFLAPLIAERTRTDPDGNGLSYYDNLLDDQRHRQWEWGEQNEETRETRPFVKAGLVKVGPPPFVREFLPLQRARYANSVLETNSFGMRDREYALEKPPNTLRIAALGSCVEMGVGVDNPEVWDAVLERLLAAELTPSTGQNYEVLNFSTPGCSLPNHYFVMRDRIARSAPDVVLVSSHIGSTIDYFREIMRHPRPWPPELTAIVDCAGLEPGMKDRELRQRVTALRKRIEHCSLARIAAECRAIGATPVFLEVPDFDLNAAQRNKKVAHAQWLRATAQDTDFELISLEGLLTRVEITRMTITSLGHVPTVEGQHWLAKQIHRSLLAQPSLLGQR